MVEFWKNSFGWPRDNASYIFLARAVHAIGKSMFGADWTGEEPCTELMRPLPVIPERSGWKAQLAHDLLIKHHPEFNRQPVKSFRGLPPSFEFTGKEWMAACVIVAKYNEQHMPSARRFSETIERIVQLAEAGSLVTAIRKTAGGDPTPMPREWWNSERIRNRFDMCQMNPREPFGLGFAGDYYEWIFVSRESLLSCTSDASTDEDPRSLSSAQATPLPAENQARPRRLAQAMIEPEFRRWREQQPDGYIPTEPEDIAHMKRLGVGRDAVRKLRKDFPKRARGEKKSG